MIVNMEMIRHRVMGAGGIKYMERLYASNEKLERSAIIRQILKDTSFRDLSNNDIDRCRLEKAGDSYILEDSAGYETMIKGSSISESDSRFRRIRAMIPFKYQGLRGNDFNWSIYNVDVGEQLRLINGFMINFNRFREEGKGLYIYSQTKGSGKTMLACCLLNELSYRYAVSTKFVTVLDFIEMTKKSFKGEMEDVDAIYKAGVLILDDIGVQMSKEWVDTVLYRLINDRYNNKRITIYTSNIPVDKLKIDERTAERIEADTFCIDMPEVPIRKQQTNETKDQLLDTILKNAPNQVGA